MKPGYKLTEAGVLPEDWDSMRFNSRLSSLDARTDSIGLSRDSKSKHQRRQTGPF
jgi:hypothetical protein